MKSVEEHTESSDILKKEIQVQSKAEAEGILKQAEKEGNQILDDARKEAEKIKNDLLQKAGVQADGIRQRILSGVHLEINKQALQDREELISKLFQAVEEKINQFRRSDSYLSFLKKLVLEGIVALGGGKLIILPGEVEKKLLTKKVLSQIEKEAHEKHGGKIVLSLSDQILTEGGVVLETSDGKTRFDNRFSARIKRIENDMRLVAVRRVMEGGKE